MPANINEGVRENMVGARITVVVGIRSAMLVFNVSHL